MAGLDKDQFVTEVVPLTYNGMINEGARVQLSDRSVPLSQLQEGALFVVGGGEEVFRLQGGVATELGLALDLVGTPLLGRYMCEEGGYGPDTGRPIL